MPIPYPSAPVWPEPNHPPSHNRKADMQQQHQHHHQQQQQHQQQRHHNNGSSASSRQSPQHHRSNHHTPYSSQPNFSFMYAAASPSSASSTHASPTHSRNHTAPSHPHITLQDLSYFSQSPAPLAQQQRGAGGGSDTQQTAAASASLNLPPPPHHRGGAKSYSADITPYNTHSIHSNQHHTQQSSHVYPPSPTSAMRVHSPRNNNVVHLSAAALEFSPTTQPTRPSSAQLAAVSGSPPSPHSGRSISSSSSSTSSASSNAVHGQRRLSRASSNVSSGSPLAVSLARNISASSSTAMGASSTASISHSSLTASTSSIASSAASSLSFPLHPCADYDTTWHLSVEQSVHLSYLLSFRTSVCPHYASPSSAMPCPHNASTCFLSHSRLPRRRRPTLLNGRFNYLPTRCRYLPSSSSSDDADTLCPQGVHCRFAHCTEEVIYHPSKYKTQLCPHRLDDEGRCSGYGMHCAKAHGQPDLRVGVYEVGEDGGGGASGWREDDRVQFVCAEWEQDEERRYYEFAYKTKRCEGFPYNCQCDGFDWHREEERRRPPPILYAPIACPNIKPSTHSDWSHPALDCSGIYRAKVFEHGAWRPQRCEVWACEYAHTLLELMYHPQVYHTGQCDKWDDKDVRRWRCVWKRRCAHAHGRTDARSKEEATEEWKEHIRQAVGPAAAPALIARLTHPQGPQAAGNLVHAASAPLPISEGEETDGRLAVVTSTNTNNRSSVNGGHVRSVSQPVELLGHSQYSSQQNVAVNLNASSPTAQQMGMTLQARSHSQHVLQLPNNVAVHNNSNSAGSSPAISPNQTHNHNHKGRISPRPLSIPSPIPSTHSSTSNNGRNSSASPHSLPATPTSASSSVSLSLFDIHGGSSDGASRLWGSPGAAAGAGGSGVGGVGSVDDSALHHTVGWNAPRSVPVLKQHHRRSVTMNDAFHTSTAYHAQPLYNNNNNNSNNNNNNNNNGSAFPLPKAPLALHIPSTAASSASASVISSNSASPTHLVPRNLFSNTASLTASQVASPTALGRLNPGAGSAGADGSVAGGGRLLDELRRMDGGERMVDDGAGVGAGGSGCDADVAVSVVRQLEGLLTCPFSMSACSTRPHLLHQPVQMSCCGVAVCGGCVDLFISCSDEQRCSCGHRYDQWEQQQLSTLPTQRLLSQITALLTEPRLSGRS